MKYVINDQVVLSQVPEGPLVAHIDSFADFSRWLKNEDVELHHITPDYSGRYLRCRAQQVKPCRSDNATLSHLIDFLSNNKIIPTQEVAIAQLTPAERCAQEYEQYLFEMRNLAKATILNYVPFVLRFLKYYFGDKSVELSRLCARDIVKFVQYQAPLLHRKCAKLMTCALRSFLTYGRYRGQIMLDLAAAVPVVPNWSMSSIPRAISPEHVEQLLASIDQSTTVGCRDYAILLLLARLGLRSCEVVSLELDDIDWNAGTLTVLGKSNRRNEFPLPLEVGSAIAAYLHDGRPQSNNRRVFLRTKAPIRGFLGSNAISSIVRHSLKRAGINAPTCGAHQFRHGLATEMLRQGASLGEIGDVLGHSHPQTTMIYTKVDLEALRTLALPWPGDAQ